MSVLAAGLSTQPNTRAPQPTTFSPLHASLTLNPPTLHHPLSTMFTRHAFTILSLLAPALAFGSAEVRSSLTRRQNPVQVVISCSTGASGCACPTDLNGDAGVLINVFPVRFQYFERVWQSPNAAYRDTNARTRTARARGPTTYDSCFARCHVC
jgi:hypothetical protein